jgi:hypothetical protein
LLWVVCILRGQKLSLTQVRPDEKLVGWLLLHEEQSQAITTHLDVSMLFEHKLRD